MNTRSREEHGIMHWVIIDSLWIVGVRVFALVVSLHDPQSLWRQHYVFQVSWIYSRAALEKQGPSALEAASAATEYSKMAHVEMLQRRPYHPPEWASSLMNGRIKQGLGGQTV